MVSDANGKIAESVPSDRDTKTSNPVFKCLQCNEIFPLRFSLLKHNLIKHHNQKVPESTSCKFKLERPERRDSILEPT